jgi:hypothetical protein
MSFPSLIFDKISCRLSINIFEKKKKEIYAQLSQSELHSIPSSKNGEKG